jgi:hypothetical protein
VSVAAATARRTENPALAPAPPGLDQENIIIAWAFERSFPISIGMEADFPSLDQLHNNAAECIRLAEAARTSQHKSLFIEMAERWVTLAEHAEKTQAR